MHRNAIRYIFVYSVLKFQYPLSMDYIQWKFANTSGKPDSFSLGQGIYCRLPKLRSIHHYTRDKERTILLIIEVIPYFENSKIDLET